MTREEALALYHPIRASVRRILSAAIPVCNQSNFIPLAPVNGREAIANNISSFIRPGAPGIESIQFRIINIAASGPIVMTERVDVFKLPHKSFELPVMGTFEISDGKIKAWRDYFDTNQFNSRMR